MITTIAAPSLWIFFEWNRTLSMTLAKSNSVKFKMNTRNFYDCTKHSFIRFRFWLSVFFPCFKWANEQAMNGHFSSDKRVLSLRHIHLWNFAFLCAFWCWVLLHFFFVLARAKKSHFFFLSILDIFSFFCRSPYSNGCILICQQFSERMHEIFNQNEKWMENRRTRGKERMTTSSLYRRAKWKEKLKKKATTKKLTTITATTSTVPLLLPVPLPSNPQIIAWSKNCKRATTDTTDTTDTIFRLDVVARNTASSDRFLLLFLLMVVIFIMVNLNGSPRMSCTTST